MINNPNYKNLVDASRTKWENNYQNNRFFLKWPDEMVVRFMNNNMKHSNKKVLDLGCGSGRHSELFVENGYEVYGCDISTKSIEMTKKRLKRFHITKRFLTADSWNLPYEDNFFDYVVGWHSIYYNSFIQLQKTLEEIYRVLNKDGIVLVSLLSHNDYRRSVGKRIANKTYVGSNNAADHQGMLYSIIDKHDIKDLFHNFKKIIIGYNEFSFDLTNKRCHWIVTAKK